MNYKVWLSLSQELEKQAFGFSDLKGGLSMFRPGAERVASALSPEASKINSIMGTGPIRAKRLVDTKTPLGSKNIRSKTNPGSPIQQPAATPIQGAPTAATPKKTGGLWNSRGMNMVKGVAGAGALTAGIVGAGTVWGGLTMEPGMNSNLAGEGPAAPSISY